MDRDFMSAWATRKAKATKNFDGDMDKLFDETFERLETLAPWNKGDVVYNSTVGILLNEQSEKIAKLENDVETLKIAVNKLLEEQDKKTYI